MTNDVDKLQKAHADFAQLLGLLEVQIKLFHDGEQPDYNLMLDIFYYMTHYPDRFHHPKEDLAFARLAQRAPDTGAKVEELARLHRVIAESGARFLGQLDAALARAMLSRASVELPALEYITLYRGHMKMEERELFPVARVKLGDEDWADVNATVGSGQDPLFGQTVEERYRAIHHQIVQAAECGCAVD